MSSKIVTAVLLLAALHTSAQQTDPKTKAEPPKPKIDYHEAGAPMPTMKLVSFDTLEQVYEGHDLKKAKKKYTKKYGYAPATKIYDNDDIKSDAPVFVMMFNPTCGHCEEQTDRIEKSIARFKGSQFVMLTYPNNKQYMPDFIRNHKVKNFAPQVIIGVDSASFISETFLYGALPQISVYSKEHKLLKSYNGEIVIDSLVKYLEP